MLFGFFKHDYVARRFKEDTYENGYAAPGGSEDFTVTLNVQPLNDDELQALPEGERTVRHVKTIGEVQFVSADEESDTQGDRLFYEGRWFECKSCHKWDHTLLSHYESVFVEMDSQHQGDAPETEVEG